MKVQYELASFSGHTQLFITCRMEVTESWVGPGNEASMSIIVFGKGKPSLVPRLPRSGTRTLKLCRRGEPGIFCHVKSTKDRKEVERT